MEKKEKRRNDLEVEIAETIRAKLFVVLKSKNEKSAY